MLSLAALEHSPVCAFAELHSAASSPSSVPGQALGRRPFNPALVDAVSASGSTQMPHLSRFVLSRSAALTLAQRATSFPTTSGSATPAGTIYVACADSTGAVSLCLLTPTMIPQLAYSSLSGLPVLPTAVAQLTRAASDYQSFYDPAGAASAAMAASVPLSMAGAASGVASLGSNGLVPLTQIPALPYDASGAAASALASAEAFSTNASNLQSGIVSTTLLPTASSSSQGIVRCDGTTVTCASGVISAVSSIAASGATLPNSGIVNATSPTTASAATSAQIVAALNTAPTTQLATTLIPTLNQNTTGTAANALEINGASLPKSAGCLGTNGSQQLVPGNCAATVASSSLGKNVTLDFGSNNLVADGVTNNSAKLQAIANSVNVNGSPQLNFPCGNYYFSTSVLMTGNLLSLIGEGTSGHNGNGCVNIQSNQPIDSIWEFATANQAGGANLNGPRVEHFNFQDTSSGGNQVRSGLKVTDENNLIINDVNFQGFLGSNYTAGAITLTSGSSTVTCQGCNWTSAMAPGILQYNGYPYEVVGYNSPTSLTLAVDWPLATVTSSAGGYSLHFKGIGLWLYPGYSGTASSYDFTQYGTVDNIKASQTWNPIFLSSGQADSLNSHEGTSRISFNSGYINCGLQDSIGIWMGVYTDTTHYHVSENNCSFGAVIAGGHSNDIMSSKFENAGASATVLSDGVSTCSIGSPSNNSGIPCTKGVLVMGVSATTGSTAANQNNNNEVALNYFAQYGNDVEIFAGNFPPQKTQVMGNQHIANAVNAVFDGGLNSQILDSGMVQLFNKVTQQAGTGTPLLPCGNSTSNHVGSKFYNINGGAGSTEYICRATGWVGVE